MHGALFCTLTVGMLRAAFLFSCVPPAQGCGSPRLCTYPHITYIALIRSLLGVVPCLATLFCLTSFHFWYPSERAAPWSSTRGRICIQSSGHESSLALRVSKLCFLRPCFLLIYGLALFVSVPHFCALSLISCFERTTTLLSCHPYNATASVYNCTCSCRIVPPFVSLPLALFHSMEILLTYNRIIHHISLHHSLLVYQYSYPSSALDQYTSKSLHAYPPTN